MPSSTTIVAAIAVTIFAAAPTASPHQVTDPAPGATVETGRQVLAPGDGWAAEGAGTTGGSAATTDHVVTVANRAQLIQALGGNNSANARNTTPTIIYVRGTIAGNVDDANRPLSCAQLADPGYSLDEFLRTYDPAVWGRTDPTGPLEDARVRSAANQSARVRINVGSNKTIIGLDGAVLNGVLLRVDGADNVIIRNIEHQDARDCFPQWSPTDGATGNWNSEYDNIFIRNSRHVWIDHNTFTDADNPDSNQPIYFGRPFQVHDGETDITNGANFVTVSYNRYTNHDKTMLIGSTNTPGVDVGALKVTLHHNAFVGTLQRTPRVRFGQVDVYDNLFQVPADQPFEYGWGVGVQSAIYAENNYVDLAAGVTPDRFIFDWGGTALTETGTWVRVGDAPAAPVSLLGAYNASHDPDLGSDAGWTPTLRAGTVQPASDLPSAVEPYAGAGHLPLP